MKESWVVEVAWVLAVGHNHHLAAADLTGVRHTSHASPLIQRPVYEQRRHMHLRDDGVTSHHIA